MLWLQVELDEDVDRVVLDAGEFRVVENVEDADLEHGIAAEDVTMITIAQVTDPCDVSACKP